MRIVLVCHRAKDMVWMAAFLVAMCGLLLALQVYGECRTAPGGSGNHKAERKSHESNPS